MIGAPPPSAPGGGWTLAVSAGGWFNRVWRDPFVRSAVALGVAVATVGLLPEPSMVGCLFAGPCHAWHDRLAGFVLVLLSLVIGPRRVWFLGVVSGLLVLLSSLEMLRTGEAQHIGLPGVLRVLPQVEQFQGGMLGGVVAYAYVYVVNRTRGEAGTRDPEP